MNDRIARAHAAVSGLNKEQRTAIASIIRDGGKAMRGVAEQADTLVTLLEEDPPRLDVLAREMDEFRTLINGLTSMFSLVSMSARVATSGEAPHG